jgi:folate-binding protein YgfZ
MPIIYLPDRGVLRVSGAEARTFLQGLVSCDMAKVEPGRPGFGALLTPQGKVMFDFLVVEAEEADGGGFYLDTARVLAPDLAQRLAMYRLRASVTIEDMSEALGIGVVVGEAAFDPMEYLAYADPRLAALGQRLIGERAGLAALGGDIDAYHGERVALGVPEGGKDFAYNDVFPHEVLMDQLHGVDFHKGCYVGQEVVSRMQHRANVRTRIVALSFEGGFAAVEGCDIVAGGKVIGKTGSQSRGRGLALLRLDKYADAVAAGLAVTAGGIGIVAHRPAYATYDFAGAAA